MHSRYKTRPKLALDIHGVIDAEPEFFSWLSHLLKYKGHEIHIVTGGKFEDNVDKLKEWGIYYDHFFSITDYHISLGTPIISGCADGEMCIADSLWDRAKGDYCEEHDITIIVDDTPHYAKFMKDTHFEYWPKIKRNMRNTRNDYAVQTFAALYGVSNEDN